jgi:hypothetical protein
MANLTDVMEVRALDYFVRGTTPAALSTPMRVQLVSALGSGDAASTPIAGAIQPLGASAPTSGAGTTSNAALIRFEGLTNPTTVAGYRIIDSAGTPVVTLDNIARTGGPVSVTDGVFEIPAGELVVTAA